MKRKLLHVFFFCVGVGQLLSEIAYGRTTVPLFVIERTKNANCVHYEANIDGSHSDQLDPNQPISVYWEMKAEDGRREELSSLERRRAYGFNLTKDYRKPGSFIVRLVPYKKRSIQLYMKDKTPVAEIVINAKPAKLQKLFIKTEGTGLIPRVVAIELFGSDLKTSEPVYEKIIP